MTALEKFLVFLALPGVLGLSLIEGWVLSRHSHFDWKALGVSVCDMLLRALLTTLAPLSFAAPLVELAWQHRLISIDLGAPVSWIALYVGIEFCYYWSHRAAHRVRWFWLNHSVHHSSSQLNLSAAYRLGVLGRLTGTVLFFAPLVWIGFPVEVVLAALTVDLLYQFWIHAAWVPRLGWLEWVLNTPSAHRVHHAANIEYADGNFGGMLIVFDRLFGTYVAERTDVPCLYGWTKPPTSYNLLSIVATEWRSLARELAQAQGITEVLGLLLMPPGWPHTDRVRALGEHGLRRRRAAARAD